VEELEDEDDDPVESFLNARRDAGLSLAAEALHAGYDTDEEVYAAAEAVDKGLLQYDSDDNPIVTFDKKKMDLIAPLDHTEIDYEEFRKDFYEESAAISGMIVFCFGIFRFSLHSLACLMVAACVSFLQTHMSYQLHSL
jgi:ATP-dependent RNA helicase DDX42